MKPVYLLVALTLLTPAALPAQECPRFIEYVTSFAADTISKDHAEFRGDTIVGSLLGMGGPDQWALVRYRALIAPDGLFRGYATAIWPIAADSNKPPTQVSEVSFGPRAVIAVLSDSRRGSQIQTDSVVAGTMPFMDNAPLFIAALARRALALNADSVEIPMLWLFTGGHKETVTVVRRGADSLLMRTPRMKIRAAISSGRLLGSWRDDSVQVTRKGCG